MPEPREIARRLAREHIERGDPLGWFEELYASAQGDSRTIPWADRRVNPSLRRWLDRRGPPTPGRSALVVGCGLGDDAEEAARRGFRTTGFDISPTAIRWCRERFPGSPVEYVVADALNPPSDWKKRFDCVIESYTLQALPPEPRRRAIGTIAGLVAPSGSIVVICRAREESDPQGELPWPLTRAELRAFESEGLREASFEDFVDEEQPPRRRFMAEYVRSAQAYS